MENLMTRLITGQKCPAPENMDKIMRMKTFERMMENSD
jgi:hypothetical protein